MTEPQLARWIEEDGEPFGREQLSAATHERIGTWNELGLRLCGAFLAIADSRAAQAA